MHFFIRSVENTRNKASSVLFYCTKSSSVENDPPPDDDEEANECSSVSTDPFNEKLPSRCFGVATVSNSGWKLIFVAFYSILCVKIN